MLLNAVIAALTVAFPKEGARLPAVDSCYVIGAAPEAAGGAISVQGKSVSVYRTGAWSAFVPVVEGSNTITVVCGAETNLVGFSVAAKPKKTAAGAEEASAKSARREKLPYAAPSFQGRPIGKAPFEIVIALDPGHGGKDTGALSPHGFPEKDANLRTARETKKALEKLGYNVVMTRDDDTFVELYDRPKAAHSSRYDAFVSIHHNAPPVDRDPALVRYGSVYVWDGADQLLARAVADALAKEFDGELPSKGVLSANFAVTRSTQVPSCLVEVDFITSPQGEEAVWNAVRRRRTGNAIARGIDAWVKGAVSAPAGNISKNKEKQQK